jgi:glucosyl-dolichyl phosphate glucuronosyltransferase
MMVTIILCTYNRAHSLGTALESVLASALPFHLDWELLVVDNNSRDRTREVIQAFYLRHPGRVRYIFEARQGLSNARNAGIRAARGEILAFVDDDVTVEPTWLDNLTASLRDGHWAGAGGRILPPKGFSPPPWLALQGPWGQGGVLCALFDLGDIASQLKAEPPYGTNMAFRTEMFEKYGVFRTDLGHCGDNLIGNEDTEFGRRLMTAGERLRYEPFAVVYHSVPAERLNKRYFRAWWFAYGRAQIRERGPRARVWGIPRFYFSLPKTALRLFLPEVVRALLARDPHERFRRQCFVCCLAGNMAEIWNLRKTTKYSGINRIETGTISWKALKGTAQSARDKV